MTWPLPEGEGWRVDLSHQWGGQAAQAVTRLPMKIRPIFPKLLLASAFLRERLQKGEWSGPLAPGKTMSIIAFVGCQSLLVSNEQWAGSVWGWEPEDPLKRAGINGWKGCLIHPSCSLQGWLAGIKDSARVYWAWTACPHYAQGLHVSPFIEVFEHRPPEKQVICLHFTEA